MSSGIYNCLSVSLLPISWWMLTSVPGVPPYKKIKSLLNSFRLSLWIIIYHARTHQADIYFFAIVQLCSQEFKSEGQRWFYTNDLYFASSGQYNGIKLQRCIHHMSYDIYISTYLLFWPSTLPQPLCPEGWLDLLFLLIKKQIKTEFFMNILYWTPFVYLLNNFLIW